MSNLLKIPEAGLRLGVSRYTVYRLINAGDLPVVNVAETGKQPRLRIRPQDLDDFIEARTHTAPDEAVPA